MEYIETIYEIVKHITKKYYSLSTKFWGYKDGQSDYKKIKYLLT